MKATVNRPTTVPVWDAEAGAPAVLDGLTSMRVSIVRPDSSLVVRDARTYGEPSRVEVDVHPQDLTMPGLYVGELQAEDEHGHGVVLSRAFKLRVPSELV